MLRKTIIKLALSLFGASIMCFVLSSIIITLIGSANSTPFSSTSSIASGSSTSLSSSSSLSKPAASSSKSITSKSTVSKQSTTPTSKILLDFTPGKIMLGIICTLFFIIMMFNVAWHEGSLDPNRVKYGHIKKYMAKGLVAGLLATIPNAIILISFLISKLFYSDSTFATISTIIFRVYNIQFIVFSDATLKIPLLCFIYLLPMPIVSGISYVMGYKLINPIPKIINKNPKKRRISRNYYMSKMNK